MLASSPQNFATGFLVIALGNKNYGKMSAVLAASIKNQSSIPVAVIHDGNALNDLSPRMRGLFDQEIFVPIDASKPDNENAFRLKLDVYRLSPFEKTILLDADNIMLPGKKADVWFDELKGTEFTACNSGYYDYPTSTDYGTKYPYWADPLVVKQHFNIANPKFPQINSSFIYFEKGQKAAEVFRIARTVWDDNTFLSATYRNSKTDEFCFNTACAITGIYPHQFPFHPLYFLFASENFSEEHITDNYLALSVITELVDQRVIDLYNKYMEYYFKKFGFTKLFYYSQKTEKEPRKIYGFWHIAAMNNYKDVVTEQLNILLNDGLYEASEKIFVNIAGANAEAIKLFEPYPKIQIAGTSELSEFEFPALILMKSYACNEKFYGYYFHTKGVSGQNNPNKTAWRDLLNHYTLRCWQRCYTKVRGVYDVAGANWKDATSDHPPHYSGNFYWFDSDYIKRLPEVHTLNRKNRYEAEMWLSKCSPKHYCVAYHTMQDDIADWFPKRKIGIFWQVNGDYSSKMQLLRNSGLLGEAHHSMAFSETQYDFTGFFGVATNAAFEANLRSYCTLNPDAFIALATHTDGIFDWKRCYEMLQNGYDSICKDDKIVWATAGYINSLGTLEDLNKKNHRKFLLI